MPTITKEAYDEIAPQVKDGIIQARHMAAMQLHEKEIFAALQQARSAQPEVPVHEFAVALMHCDEEIMPDEAKAEIKSHNDSLLDNQPRVEFWFGVMSRFALVKACTEWEMKSPQSGQDPHCYAAAGKKISVWKPEIPESFIIAVFMDGMMSTWPVAFGEGLGAVPQEGRRVKIG